jgi:hypothetical protein
MAVLCLTDVGQDAADVLGRLCSLGVYRACARLAQRCHAPPQLFPAFAPPAHCCLPYTHLPSRTHPPRPAASVAFYLVRFLLSRSAYKLLQAWLAT